MDTPPNPPVNPLPEQPELPLPTVTAKTVLDVASWLGAGDVAKVSALAEELQPVDVAGLLELSAPDDRRMMIGLLEKFITPEVLSHLATEVRDEVLERLQPKQIADAVAELESDDAVEIVEEMDEPDRKAVLENLPQEERQAVEEALGYPEGSAARLMQREAVAVPQDWTIGKTIDHLREQAENLPPDFYEIVVLDPWRRVAGSVGLNRVLREQRVTNIVDIMNEDIQHIPALMDQAEIAYLFKRYRLQSAPVVDAEDKLLGVLTIDDIVDVMEEEAEAEIFHLGGVAAEESIHDDVVEVTKSRFAWLFVNLITAILAALTIGVFEESIQKVVALAVLMPIVASMGGNAGTQTLTVAVRALATKELGPSNYWRLVGREIMIGAANGLGFAVLMGAIVWWWFHSAAIGAVIGAAMIINLIAAGFTGALIPITLRRMGIDPAIASAVFLTTVTDVVGFAAFLGLATLVLF